MASMLYCDVCDKRDKTSIAKKFCSDCEDKLCSDCLEVHSAVKSCVNHHVVDVTVSVDQSLTVEKYCEKHADLLLEFYCCDHEVICCRSCMADDHRTCKNLTPIEVSSKDIKSSNMYDEISKQAGHLKEASHLLTNAVQNSKTLLDKSKVASIDKVSRIKEGLHKRIDELANDSVAKITKLYCQLSGKVDEDKEEVKQRVQIIQDTITKFEFVAKHGSDKQIFLHLNSVKTDIHKIDASLEEFVPTLKTTTVEFEESDTFTMLKSIGSTKTAKRPCVINYKPVNQQQAHFNMKSRPALTSFQLEKKVTFTYQKTASITGMCVTKDSRIILCNWRDNVKELLVLTNEGKFIQTMELTERPWKIEIEPGTTDAWVTLPLAAYLQVIGTKFLSLKHQLIVSKGCYGIAFVGTNIALGMDGKVDIINKQGVYIKTVNVCSKKLYSLCCTEMNKIYCCESSAHIIHCVTLDGINVFSVISHDLLGPISVNEDHQGYIYILCWKSSNLHRVTADGKYLGVILDKNEGLKTPKTAAFNENGSKLFITNESTKELFIFSCK